MNNKLVMWLVAALLVVGLFFVFTGGSDDDDTDTDDTTQVEEDTTAEDTGSNVVELAQATDDLSTLVTAVVEAGLVDTLSGDGPFTVFAPTNAAFTSLLETLDITVEELLARDDLSDILTYHVVPAEAFAADLSDGQELTTVQGGVLTVNVGDTVTITDVNGNVATVTTADVDANNGVVHIIDTVVLP